MDSSQGRIYHPAFFLDLRVFLNSFRYEPSTKGCTLELLEKNIGYVFKDKALLIQALTHRSYLNENKRLRLKHNERLEFLGDIVLEMVVTNYLFRTFPDKNEGELTSMRSFLVNNDKASEISEGLGVNGFFYMSRGESTNLPARKRILANAFEAIVAAIYLDGGYRAAEKFVQLVLLSTIDPYDLENDHKDPKSRLQEVVQREERVTPAYKLLASEGPDHDKTFVAAVYIGVFEAGRGKGASRLKAELAAAQEALKRYGLELV